jgi:16S rRNA (guanine1207-N2)-methyltransferase
MSHYFSEQQSTRSDEREIRIGLVEPPLTLRTDHGVFSHGRLDAGTAMLLRQAPAPPSQGTLLDLGCGAGAIALTLARRAPDADVVAVDINVRARALCAANADRNGITNVEVAGPDEVDPAVGFDLIWSNPPIRIGKAALHDLLTTWLRRLLPEATAVLVVQRNLGADSLQRWLADRGWPTERLASSKGYRLLRVTAPARAASDPRRIDDDADP